MKKYEFSSSLTGITDTIEADGYDADAYHNSTVSFYTESKKNGRVTFATYFVGPGSFVREIKESKDA